MARMNKIVSKFAYLAPGSGIDKLNRIDTAFIEDQSYINEIDVDSEIYKGMASTNIENIFMPFSTSGSVQNFPKFYDLSQSAGGSTIRAKDLLPFKINTTGSGYYYSISTSGLDTQRGFLAGNNPYHSEYIRHQYEVRGIGLRLPQIGVGWGYTTAGTPFPAGSGTNKFKGEYSNGYEVDPKDYIAAPIDFRYDTDRNVWTAGDSRTKHKHLADTTADGGPAFAGFFADSLAEASGLGYLSILPVLAV